MSANEPIPPIELVHAVVCLAGDDQRKLTRTALVKFLYLADLYQARVSGGTTLSGFPWRFLHYGPWCEEVASALDNAEASRVVEVEKRQTADKEYYLYSCSFTVGASPPRQLPTMVDLPLRKAIREWSSDLPGLLNHVYFETEPMANVSRGDILDFALARPQTHSRQWDSKPLSASKLREGRELVRRITERVKGALTAGQGTMRTAPDADPVPGKGWFDEADGIPDFGGIAEIGNVTTDDDEGR